jgi:hypothetical protein
MDLLADVQWFLMFAMLTRTTPMLREYYTTKPQAPNWIVEVNVLIPIYEDLKENSDIG